MSHYEVVIGRCKKLERLLEDELGATGRGLHEKVTSVQSRLPAPLVKKLRFIATVRNKLVHEDEGDTIDDPAGYKRACDEAERQLKSLNRPAKRGCMGGVLLVVLLIGLAVLATQTGCWMRLPTTAPAVIHSRVGSVATVKQDLYLTDWFDSYIAEPADGYRSDRKYVAKVPSGSRVTVKGVVSRRLPAGIFYYYVCRSDAVSQTFDVQVNKYWENGEDDSLYLQFSP